MGKTRQMTSPSLRVPTILLALSCCSCQSPDDRSEMNARAYVNYATITDTDEITENGTHIVNAVSPRHVPSIVVRVFNESGVDFTDVDFFVEACGEEYMKYVPNVRNIPLALATAPPHSSGSLRLGRWPASRLGGQPDWRSEEQGAVIEFERKPDSPTYLKLRISGKYGTKVRSVNQVYRLRKEGDTIKLDPLKKNNDLQKS